MITDPYYHKIIQTLVDVCVGLFLLALVLYLVGLISVNTGAYVWICDLVFFGLIGFYNLYEQYRYEKLK